MSKRKQVYIVSIIVILVGVFLIFFPDFFPNLFRKIEFQFVEPKNYQECVWAGGQEKISTNVHIADGESCKINGKVYSPWSL